VTTKETETTIELPQLEIERITITVIGDSPLIMHKWSEKAKEQMRTKQQKKPGQGREAKNPKKDFEDCIHRMEDGHPGFPSIGFKAAAVTACTSIAGMTKVAARQAFHILGELTPIIAPKPTMREDMVRVGMGVADIRYRPEFWPWSATLEISYNTRAFSIAQIMNLLNTAGFGVGIGEWRPERDGQYGLALARARREKEHNPVKVAIRHGLDVRGQHTMDFLNREPWSDRLDVVNQAVPAHGLLQEFPVDLFRVTGWRALL